MYNRISGTYQNIEDAVMASKTAYQSLSGMSIRDRENMITDLRLKLLNHIGELAAMEWEETGMGVLTDKAVQIERAIIATPGPDSIHCEASNDDEGLFLGETFPYGVAVSAHPINHPTASIINCNIMLLSAGNTVINLLPGRAEKVARYTVELINNYLSENCGISDLSICMSESRFEYNKAFMEHPDTDLVVVTGGDDFVKGIMSLKKRVIAAGSANPVAIVDKDFDLSLAAKIIAGDVSFDNNLLCTSEKSAVVIQDAIGEFGFYLAKEGAYLLNADEADIFLNLIFNEDQDIRKEYIGKSAEYLLKEASILNEIYGKYRLIAFETEVISPFVLQEFAAPVLPIVAADSFEEAVRLACYIEQGRHHSACVFSNNVERLSLASRTVQTSVFVKNGSTLYAAGIKGRLSCTFTIANVTGEGPVTPELLSRSRKCILVNSFGKG